MSLYRNIAWFMKGIREYTKNGYLSASKDFNSSDLDVDIGHRSYMITGANSGIGRYAALTIAKKGGTVHMVCRNKDRGMAAQKDIQEEAGNQNVHLHIVDLSRPAEIVAFTKQFKDSGHTLNVLINNAGVLVIDDQRQVTADGLETTFATNTLGVHMLTQGLIPVLKLAEDPRVIIVTSGGMLVQKLDVKDLQFENMSKFDGTMAYSQTKRQEVVLTSLYAKLHPEIHFSCMHPGWADTPVGDSTHEHALCAVTSELDDKNFFGAGNREANKVYIEQTQGVQSSLPQFYDKMKDRLRSEEQGTDTVIWLAVSPAATKYDSGLFFQDRRPVPSHLPLAWTKSSPSEEQELISKLDELAKKYGAV